MITAKELKWLQSATLQGKLAKFRPILSWGYVDSKNNAFVTSNGYALHYLSIPENHGLMVVNENWYEFNTSYNIAPNNFPDYQAVMNQTKHFQIVKVSATELYRAVSLAHIHKVYKENYAITRINFLAGNTQEITIAVRASNEEGCTETIVVGNCRDMFDSGMIVLNSKLLLNALSLWAYTGKAKDWKSKDTTISIMLPYDKSYPVTLSNSDHTQQAVIMPMLVSRGNKDSIYWQ